MYTVFREGTICHPLDTLKDKHRHYYLDPTIIAVLPR